MPPPQTADLCWYELDQPDVIAAKQQLLRELLAEVPGAAGASQGSGSSLDDLPAEPGSPVESGLSRHLRWECASACAVVLAQLLVLLSRKQPVLHREAAWQACLLSCSRLVESAALQPSLLRADFD